MQILWLVVVAVLAAGLIKLAFFPDNAPKVEDPSQPTGQIIEPHYTVARATVSNDVTLTGTVAADEAVPLPATLNGVVTEVLVGVGQQVSPGQPIVTVKGQGIKANGQPYNATEQVLAPIAGTISSLPTIRGASTTIGQSVGNLAPATFHLTGTIPPDQLYRLIQPPTEAKVTVTGGPAPFTCTGLQILTPLAGADSGQGGVSGPTLRCAVPAEVTVFAGLSAQIVISGGVAEDAIVVPTSAVLGRSGTGTVYLVQPDGSTKEATVQLGINDGTNVEVTSGLDEGAEILQFVPGAPADDGSGPGGCVADANGNSVCNGVGG